MKKDNRGRKKIYTKEDIGKPYNPRKFKINMQEIFVGRGKEGSGGSINKVIDYEDAKPIYDLLTKAVLYREKHSSQSQISRIHPPLEL